MQNAPVYRPPPTNSPTPAISAPSRSLAYPAGSAIRPITESATSALSWWSSRSANARDHSGSG